MNWKGGKFGVVCLVFQVVFIALFAIFVDYDTSAHAGAPLNSKDLDKGGQDKGNNEVSSYYPSE